MTFSERARAVDIVKVHFAVRNADQILLPRKIGNKAITIFKKLLDFWRTYYVKENNMSKRKQLFAVLINKSLQTDQGSVSIFTRVSIELKFTQAKVLIKLHFLHYL